MMKLEIAPIGHDRVPRAYGRYGGSRLVSRNDGNLWVWNTFAPSYPIDLLGYFSPKDFPSFLVHAYGIRGYFY